ncbi:MAG: hypothetical protein PHQ19_06980 [Candidatus Krumholzibacteria bacterium]|nr:hypothetical protein [Candidatus Krumholzibacteria bacterium]
MTGDPNVSKAERHAGRLLAFFLRLLLASIVLYLVWTKAGIAYMYVIAWGAKPLVALTGHTLVIEQALTVTEEISLNPVVYLSLVIAVTGVPLKARIRPAAVGVAILTAANIATVFLIFLSHYRNSEQLWTGTEFLNLTINFFLPILLWFVLCPKGDTLPALTSRA